MESCGSSIVHLVDDDANVRSSLRALLELAGDCRCVGYDSAEQYLAEFKYTLGVAQCLLLDIGLPGMDGLALQRELRRRQIAIPVVILTGLADVPLAVQAVQDGALDVIQKPIVEGKLCAAIVKALDVDRSAQRRASDREKVLARLETLSPRERMVMEEVLGGRFVKEVAANLGIGTQTVWKHRSRMLKKMQVRSEIELSQVLQSLGLLQTEPRPEHSLPADRR